MKQTITFRLENPSLEKFKIWIDCYAEIDKIIARNGIVLENRTSNESEFEVTITIFVDSIDVLHNTSMAVTKLLAHHGIFTKIVYSSAVKAPTLHKVETAWTLSGGNRDEVTWQKWLALMPKIDSFALSNGVRQTRVNNHKNFSSKIYSESLDFNSFSINSFHVGKFITDAQILIEPLEDYIYSETASDDIFDKISELSQRHKQLTLF